MSSPTAIESAISTLQSAQSAVENGIQALAQFPAGQALGRLPAQSLLFALSSFQALQSLDSLGTIKLGIGAIDSAGSAFASASATVHEAEANVKTAGTETLPAAWQGPAWLNAQTVFSDVAGELGDFSTNLTTVSKALTAYADSTGPLPARDAEGVEGAKATVAAASSTERAMAPQSTTGQPTVGTCTQLLHVAANAIQSRLSAWQTFSAATEALIGALGEAAAGLRAGAFTPGGAIDPIEAIVLAQTADGAGNSEASLDIDGGIIDTNDLSLGEQRLDAMSAADQAAFAKLLQQCPSPQEAAYLYKAMAAGYPIGLLQSFDVAIHGKSPAWLQQHLDVALSAPDDQTNQPYVVEYGPNEAPSTPLNQVGSDPFNQGSYNDCVAASTMMAALQNDPVLSLFATTGFTGGPDSALTQKLEGIGIYPFPRTGERTGRFTTTQYTIPPTTLPAVGDSSLQAVEARIQALDLNAYSWGQANDGIYSPIQLYPSSGIAMPGEQNLDNLLLGSTNGAGYQTVALDSATDRQNALDQIQAQLAAGTPDRRV
jgi:hypothetical protein